MFTSKAKSETKIDLDAPLSPEVDRFLGAATAEFNAKQEALNHNWRFNSYKQWGYDQFSGILKLNFEDGAEFNADGQVLGSYSSSDHSWEWAWNNPNVEASITQDSRLVKQLGERLGISYLATGMVQVPSEDFASYLCAVGIKATDSIGIFRGKAGEISVIIMLKNPRWIKK